MEKSDKLLLDLMQGVVPVELTTPQKKAYEAMCWFLDDSNRAAGRSHVMALAYIQTALMQEGSWIRVRDHFPDRMSDQRLVRTIVSMVKPFHTKVRIDAKLEPPSIRIEHALGIEVIEKDDDSI